MRECLPSGRPARVGQRGRASGGDRASSTRATSTGSRRSGVVEPRARRGVLPRAPGDARHARVRPDVRGAPARPGPGRPRPGHARRDARWSSRPASTRRGCSQIPIGIELERFPLGGHGRTRGGAEGARPARDGVRRRLVPEGRRRLGRRPRAEADQGPRRARRRPRTRSAAARRSSSSCSRGRRAATSARSCAAGRFPSSTSSLPGCDEARARPTTPSTLYVVSLAPGGRAEGGARVDGDRRAARHDAGRPGASSSRTTSTGCSSTSRTRRRSRPGGCACRDDSALRARWRSAGRPTAEANAYRRSTRAGRRSSRGSSRCRSASMLARARRYVRAGGRWAQLLVRRAAELRAPGLLRLGRRSRRRRAGGRRHRQVQKLATRFPEPPDRLLAALPRLDVPSARPRRLALPRATPRDPGRRQPGRSRLPRVGG